MIYKLPSGENININSEQIKCTEVLFNPRLINKNIIGIHELIYKSYFNIDTEIRKLLFENIILAGGNTLFNNIAERIAKEVKQLGGNSIPF